ncbi:MAG: methylthioribulose 1-phosphate dehydratase [Candidatus Caenarcaniphilales bacterium]|nr:methylthioribulose 1-phosphate dehydratase [Candidatus Caenarcaniphilales bacterium]
MSENKEISTSLISIAKFCAEKNLVPATSGNFSARINSEKILITQSGKDKGKLTSKDLMEIDYSGKALNPSEKPSAETLLHTQIYSIFSEANFISHFHSSSSAVLSKVLLKKGINEVKLNDFELLKALSGVSTHEHTEIIPIFANDQDIARLASKILNTLKEASSSNKTHAYILAGHGLYTWGKTKAEAIRHVDAINTLIESYILELQLS